MLGLSTAAQLHPRPPPRRNRRWRRLRRALLAAAPARPEKSPPAPLDVARAHANASSSPPRVRSHLGGGGSPVRMTRAKEWSEEVEDAYRLQEAGYKDEREALARPPANRALAWR